MTRIYLSSSCSVGVFLCILLDFSVYYKLTVLRIIRRGPFELLYYAYAGTQTNFKIAENSWYAFLNYVSHTAVCSPITRNATALGSLIRPRAVTRCNLAVSDMYMRDFGKTHQIAYTYCSVGISDLKPLTGTSADQLPHRKSRSLAKA